MGDRGANCRRARRESGDSQESWKRGVTGCVPSPESAVGHLRRSHESCVETPRPAVVIRPIELRSPSGTLTGARSVRRSQSLLVAKRCITVCKNTSQA